MKIEKLIPIDELLALYEIDMSFFTQLSELELVEIHVIEQASYIHQDKIVDIERIMRLHLELDINLEGIDTIFNLLEKVERLEVEVIELRNRLKLYED